MRYRQDLFFASPLETQAGVTQQAIDALSSAWDPPPAPAQTIRPLGAVAAPAALSRHAAAKPVTATAHIAQVQSGSASSHAATVALTSGAALSRALGTVPAASKTTAAKPQSAKPAAASLDTSAPAQPAPLLARAAVAQPTTVYIDPTAAAGGNGTSAHPYNAWTFGALQAGTTYLQRAGTTYTGVIHVTTAATAAAPIVIGVYGTGAPPTLVGTVDFSGARYAKLSGFQITNPNGAGVNIQQGSSNIDVNGNLVVGAQQGIWIGNNAGANNVVENNVVLGSTGAGILIDSTQATAGNETVIANNLVEGGGSDGIEVTSNHVIIKGNTVADNGLRMAATSGIHVYTASATSLTGDYDTITGNVVAYNHDMTMQDGNGILLDQWTNNDTISSNLTIGNDGAGVALYDSYSNTVSNNTSGANGVDSGNSHSILAEFVLNEALGLAKNNLITGNTFLAFLPNGFAAFVDTEAATAGNTLSGNTFENLLGPNVYQVAGLRGASLSTWDTTLKASDHFSGVVISAPPANPSYTFTFDAGTTLPVDGHIYTLTGWSAVGGLYGK